jgi:pilus assembly protein CpaF
MSGRFSQRLAQFPGLSSLGGHSADILPPPPPMIAVPAVPVMPAAGVSVDPPVPMPLATQAEVLDFEPLALPAMYAEPAEGQIDEAPLSPPLLAPLPVATPALATPALAAPSAESGSGDLLISEKFMEAKVRLHRKLVEEVNLQALEKLSPEEARKQIFALVQQYVVAERLALNSTELNTFVSEIIDEMTGLGPLEPLLKDDTIADILINGPDVVYVERRGKMERTNTRFKDDAHLMRIVNKIVAAVGRRVDESQPLCDARLLDGSRVNVAVKPIAVDGALVSIRKFSKKKLSLDKLVEVGALRPQMLELLSQASRCKTTIIISGGTGSGKTTMLNALSAYIPEDERLITIEDAAELQLQQPHVARMETRPPNLEGKGEIRQRDLIKNALRMRPDRVILGECRGEEAFDMLQAMNTGHEGSMATVHANNPREAVSRLEQMIGMAGLPMSQTSIRGQIAAAIRLIVQLQRQSDGKRRVTSIAEITGMEGDILQMQEIFKFVRVKTDADGTIHGHFEATGVRPRFLTDLAAKGVIIPGHYFEPGKPL